MFYSMVDLKLSKYSLENIRDGIHKVADRRPAALSNLHPVIYDFRKLFSKAILKNTQFVSSDLKKAV